ncbi:MAG: virulence-associated E family protein [Candidatus Thiodiazotropha sp. (ex Monitilora ramsayi)]|nr:virulence-associated E family protein [Candidatus Thiodiazotropha sp. (ex Monitilora ramsayi)]
MSAKDISNYLTNLQWDGKSRIDSWLTIALGAEEKSVNTSDIGRKFLIGCVARALNPGCKFDNILLLEGEQGTGKSAAIQILFGHWFTSATSDFKTNEWVKQIIDYWCCELCELETITLDEQLKLKSFLSRQSDMYRPAFSRFPREEKRLTVFVATTNQVEFLADKHGNRRFWPVRCSQADLQWLQANRDQLWAEAHHLYNNGEAWW